MANGTRPVVLVLTLIVGLAVGWLIGHGQAPTPSTTAVPTVPPPAPPPPPPPVCPPAGTNLIEIGRRPRTSARKEASDFRDEGPGLLDREGRGQAPRITVQAADFRRSERRAALRGGTKGASGDLLQSAASARRAESTFLSSLSAQ